MILSRRMYQLCSSDLRAVPFPRWVRLTHTPPTQNVDDCPRQSSRLLLRALYVFECISNVHVRVYLCMQAQGCSLAQALRHP